MFVACIQDYLEVVVTSDSLELPSGQLVVLGYDAKVTTYVRWGLKLMVRGVRGVDVFLGVCVYVVSGV